MLCRPKAFGISRNDGSTDLRRTQVESLAEVISFVVYYKLLCLGSLRLNFTQKWKANIQNLDFQESFSYSQIAQSS